MARPARKKRTRAPPLAPPAPERVAPFPPPRVVRVDLVEDPRALIVCRNCGRIQRVELTELDRHLLTQLAAQHPDGWAVDGIAYSMTGACRRCREGPGR